MPLKYPKPLKQKTYTTADDVKYVVVVHPWPHIPPKDGNDSRRDGRSYHDRRPRGFQEVIDWMGTWLEKMLGESGLRPSVIYHMRDKREFVIVELPAQIELQNILGAHNSTKFLKPGWVKPSKQPSWIYEYNYAQFGHPSRKRGFDEAFASRLSHIWDSFQDSYPPPSLPPPARSSDFALPIPEDVATRLSQSQESQNLAYTEAGPSFNAASPVASTPTAPVKQERASPPIPPIPTRPSSSSSSARPIKQEPLPSSLPSRPSPNPHAFTPYVPPSHLYPRPGGTIVREPTPGPSRPSGSDVSRRTAGPRDSTQPPDFPPPRGSCPRDSTEPPDIRCSMSVSASASAPTSPSFKFTKRDPYEEEDEAKLLLQNSTHTPVKDEPVEVKMDVDDVDVMMWMWMWEQTGTVNVPVRVKEEPGVEPGLGMKAEEDWVSSSGTTGRGSERGQRVVVKDEPVDNTIPEDIFNEYMQQQQSSSSSGNETTHNHTTSVKQEPQPKSEPVDNEIPLDVYNAYMQDMQRETPSDNPNNLSSNAVISVFRSASMGPTPRGVKREREGDEENVHNRGQDVRPVKSEPLDGHADLGLLKRESESDRDRHREGGPLWRRKRERNVDAVFGESSTGSGTTGTSSNSSSYVRVKEEPGVDRSMPPPSSSRPSESSWRQRTDDRHRDRQTPAPANHPPPMKPRAGHPLPMKPKLDDRDDQRGVRVTGQRDDYGSRRSSDPPRRSTPARVKREDDDRYRSTTERSSSRFTPTASSSTQDPRRSTRVKQEDVEASSKASSNAYRMGTDASPPRFRAPTPSLSWLDAPTPGVGRSFASTPGIFDDSMEIPYRCPYNPPKDWLLDEIIASHLKKLRVRIHGTIVTGYLDGAYEGRTATVIGATRVRNNFDQTALLRFDGDDEGNVRSMLVKYIVPALPRDINESAVVLTGRRKGELVKVRQKPDSQDSMEMVVVEAMVNAGFAFLECQKDHLCACVE
ncbi:hypothetical protein D9758_009442 [Tetrapyrgos nigripes]|uniref:Uncharacterized protein n=1 Tax=Tetrapyrgos nigripes TaxID=182062 RepID=A0A8H5D4G3_9AGAR|nr:hypothetical protein D9758_009442 [Tetrapyrgos nigripes]